MFDGRSCSSRDCVVCLRNVADPRWTVGVCLGLAGTGAVHGMMCDYEDR
eukprot:COSAG02_NODE_68507_length_240_cov_72.992908_1_plen_48_part_01